MGKDHNKRGGKIFGKVILSLLILIAALISFGLIKEAVTRNKYAAEYPPPGEMVSVGDHQLHLNCSGTGQPTVVFESDLDQYGSISWAYVQPEISQHTSTCSYDRAGILLSEAGPRPRDGETIAAELKQALENAGESGPYILVGHAFGGFYVRIFAGEYLDEVCGMVLVDSGHPDQFAIFEELGVEQEIPDDSIRPLIWLLSHLGQPQRFNGPRYSLPDDIYLVQQAFIPVSSMAWFDETVASSESIDQAAAFTDFGDIPLRVLTSSSPTYFEAGGADLQTHWIALQQDLLSLSANSSIVLLEDSGHYIQYDDPEAVIQAILEVLEECRHSW